MRLVNGGNTEVVEFEKKLHALLKEHPNINILSAYSSKTDEAGVGVAGTAGSLKEACFLMTFLNNVHTINMNKQMKIQ